MKNSVLVITFSLLSLQTFSWGSEGHRITGIVALHYLDQQVKDSLRGYLGESTLPEATTWMDEIRSNHSYDYLKPLHYINIEKGQQYYPNSQGNIISELDRVIGELKDRQKYSKQQITMDLKILCHLVGDLHQPLHVGYRVDRGGNTIELDFLGKHSNLHRVWDTELIKENNITAQDCLNALSGYSLEDIKKLTDPDVIAWMNDSRANLPQVYDFNNHDIDASYCEKNKTLVEKELGLAGLRIAGILNEVFSDKGIGLSITTKRALTEQNVKGISSLNNLSFPDYVVGAAIIALVIIGLYSYFRK